MASSRIAIIKNVEIDPVLPCSKICAIALGNSATIPEKIIKETPFPMPVSYTHLTLPTKA